MSDLLEEVDEMMRQERMMALWQEHGKTFIGAIAAIIIGTAMVSGYKSWDQSVRHKGTTQLVSLLESPDFPANIKDAELKIRPGLKGIALLSAAGGFAAEDKTDEALELFEKAANDSSIPDDLKDLAIISAVRLQTSNAEAEEKLRS